MDLNAINAVLSHPTFTLLRSEFRRNSTTAARRQSVWWQICGLDLIRSVENLRQPSVTSAVACSHFVPANIAKTTNNCGFSEVAKLAQSFGMGIEFSIR